VENNANIEIERRRSFWQLIGATLVVYRRFPLLFLLLAAGVIVPYQLLVLAITGAGPLAEGHLSFATSTILTITDSFLVGPLVSALHVHALFDLRNGERPHLIAVARRSVAVLPVVSAVVIISYLGILIGLLALVVPGVLLMLRWAVVPQAAALESKSWTDALRRSEELTDGHYAHVFALVISVGAVGLAANLALGAALGHTTTSAASFIAGTALRTLISSLTALTTALLFFDLKARLHEGARETVTAEPSEVTAGDSSVPDGPGDPLTPDGYTDQGRPRGWYVDPAAPSRMRYWAADGTPGWSKRTTKTPTRTFDEWQALNERRRRS
jgi:hypothetical protein